MKAALIEPGQKPVIREFETFDEVYSVLRTNLIEFAAAPFGLSLVVDEEAAFKENPRYNGLASYIHSTVLGYPVQLVGPAVLIEEDGGDVESFLQHLEETELI